MTETRPTAAAGVTGAGTSGIEAGTGAIPGMKIEKGGLGSPAQAVALATLCVVLFLTFLDNTVVSVGLADIQSSLHAGVASLQWVVNGYALTFASFMLAGGHAGRPARPQEDHAGRGRRLLRRLGRGRAGAERRLADRRPGDHGARRGGVGARDAVGHPPRLPGPRDAGRTRSASGRRCPGWRWRSAR